MKFYEIREIVYFAEIINVQLYTPVMYRIIIRICVVYPAERNRFTGELITRITRARKTIISEVTGTSVIVTRPTKVVALPTTIEGNVTAVTETAGILREVETMTGDRETTTNAAERPLVRPPRIRTRRVTTETGTIRIIITGTTGGIAIASGTDAEIVIGKGIGDTPGTIGRRTGTGTSARVTTKRRIARGRDRDRGIAIGRHRRSGQ